MPRKALFFVLLICFMLPLETFARIKLITLPVRERVEIQLQHPDVTLVEEERIVPLVQGVNQVDFSWANTRIDADTLVFRVLEGGDIKVLSVSYPPNENALVWQVSAKKSGPARVRISYVLGQLEKSFSYRAVADHDEKHLALSQYLHVHNKANEGFGESGLWVGFGDRLKKTVGLNETKKIRLAKYQGVPVRKTYSCNPVEFGWHNRAQNKLRVPMHYVLKNDKTNRLGKSALPYGKVRIFQDDGKGTLAFVGEDWGKFTPPDDELKLFLGQAQDIVVKRTIDKSEQQRIAGNLYKHSVVVKYEIENFKDSPVTLEIGEDIRSLRNEVRSNNGRDVEWELGPQTSFSDKPDAEQSRFDKLVYAVKLPARKGAGKAEKITHKLHLVLNNEWSGR